MQDFDSIYSDYHQAFGQGHRDGAQQASQKTRQSIAKEAQQFAKQLATQISLYSTFITHFQLSKELDTQKNVKKLHSSIVQQKISELKQKIHNLTSECLESKNPLEQLDFSIELLQYDRKDLKSKFQTILSVLGIKQYEKRALQFLGSNPSLATSSNPLLENQNDEFEF